MRYFPEAAFFARTYAPSRMTEIVRLWRTDLARINESAAEALADPVAHADHVEFSELKFALMVENQAKKRSQIYSPASNYLRAKEGMQQDLISLAKEGALEEPAAPLPGLSSEIVHPSPVQDSVSAGQTTRPESPLEVLPVDIEENQTFPKTVHPEEEEEVAEIDGVHSDDMDILTTSSAEPTTQDTADAPPAPSTQEINLDDLDLDDDDWN